MHGNHTNAPWWNERSQEIAEYVRSYYPCFQGRNGTWWPKTVQMIISNAYSFEEVRHRLNVHGFAAFCEDIAAKIVELDAADPRVRAERGVV
jgi:hypothetical protein